MRYLILLFILLASCGQPDDHYSVKYQGTFEPELYKVYNDSLDLVSEHCFVDDVKGIVFVSENDADALNKHAQASAFVVQKTDVIFIFSNHWKNRTYLEKKAIMIHEMIHSMCDIDHLEGNFHLISTQAIGNIHRQGLFDYYWERTVEALENQL